jgi:hypothetical protein
MRNNDILLKSTEPQKRHTHGYDETKKLAHCCETRLQRLLRLTYAVHWSEYATSICFTKLASDRFTRRDADPVQPITR